VLTNLRFLSAGCDLNFHHCPSPARPADRRSDARTHGNRKLLLRLRDTLAGRGQGQERFDRITYLIAESIGIEVGSNCLFHDPETLELCAAEGLRRGAVHKIRMKLGEGLVRRGARTA